MTKASRCGLSKGSEEICPTGEQQRSCVIDGVEEVNGRHHQRAYDYYQPSQPLVHSLEQPIKGQGEKDGQGRGEQIAHDAEAEKCLVRGDVVGCRARITGYK